MSLLFRSGSSGLALHALPLVVASSLIFLALLANAVSLLQLPTCCCHKSSCTSCIYVAKLDVCVHGRWVLVDVKQGSGWVVHDGYLMDRDAVATNVGLIKLPASSMSSGTPLQLPPYLSMEAGSSLLASCAV